uniref:Leucine-rich repeat and fibronectin type-III domain-containing protein 5 n=1 Tax=Schistocephalus solidus TaxID=70667 RepID=A0A0X3QF65_SCHSO
MSSHHHRTECRVVTAFFLGLLVGALATTRCPLTLNAGRYACRGRGLKEVPVPIGGPEKNHHAIDDLDISNNFIEILHPDSFKPYPRLRILRLERNRLWRITEEAFRSLPHLEQLYLRGNRLAIQPGGLNSRALTSLGGLRVLDLSENPIGYLPGQIFKPLVNLVELQLETMVRDVAFQRNCFEGLAALRRLSLAHNKFKTLPAFLAEEFRRLPSLKEVKLEGNSWNCDCHLSWISASMRWRAHGGLDDTSPEGNEPRCSQPEALANRPLFSLPHSEFQCAPVALNRETTQVHEAEVGATVTLVCNFHVQPRGYIRWYKDDQVIQRRTGWQRLQQQQQQESMTRVDRQLLLHQTNLTLFGVQPGRDDGLYVCETGNKRGKASVLFPLKVIYPDAEARVARLAANNALLLALILGGCLLMILAAAVVALLWYRKAKAAEGRARLLTTPSSSSTAAAAAAASDGLYTCETKVELAGDWSETITRLVEGEDQQGGQSGPLQKPPAEHGLLLTRLYVGWTCEEQNAVAAPFWQTDSGQKPTQQRQGDYPTGGNRTSSHAPYYVRTVKVHTNDGH